MNGRHYNAVVYSEYSGDVRFDEQDRCLMDRVIKKSKENWNYFTFAKEGTEKPEINPNLLRDVWTADQVKELSLNKGNLLEILKYKNKGEEKLLKIIVKNVDTGKRQCIDIDKERENDPVIKNLKVGMKVYYMKESGSIPEFVEIVKIVGKKPEPFIPPPFPWQSDPFMYWNSRRAMKTTFTTKFWEDIREMREAKKAKEEYEKKPYFNVRLDIMKGKTDHKENLEKMKFPCWVTYRTACGRKKHLGQLVTGYPKDTVEYQLIKMEKQVCVGQCCTVWRDTDLAKLMTDFEIEVIKGETQCCKIGKFYV